MTRLRTSVDVKFYGLGILNASDRACRTVLTRFGSYCMTVDRNSIKRAPTTKLVDVPGRARRQRVATTKGDWIAKPGKPPYSHEGSLKRWIRFAYNQRERSVVIGPQLLPGKIGKGKALPALEMGGDSIGAIGRMRKVRRIRLHPHPHTLPAFRKTLPRLMGMWKYAITNRF